MDDFIDKEWRVAMGVVATGAILVRTKKCLAIGAVLTVIGGSCMILAALKDMRDCYEKEEA